jgi:hypothetical protein
MVDEIHAHDGSYWAHGLNGLLAGVAQRHARAHGAFRVSTHLRRYVGAIPNGLFCRRLLGNCFPAF